MAAPDLYGKGPTTELGSSNATLGARLPGTPGWSHFMTQGEHVPDLKWPQSTQVYERMLTNPQVWSLFMGMVLPLLDYDYGIEPGGADADYTATMAADLGLPVGLPDPGETAPDLLPGLFGFDFLQHAWEAWLALAYGHAYFEPVGKAGADTPDGLWHVERLSPRTQQDISDILTTDNGDLAGIMYPCRTGVRGAMGVITDRPITADRLVPYVWLPDGRRRWVGRAMLRACYEPFILRDPLVRIDVINHERAGGVPVAETDETWEGSDLTELQQMASAFRVGSTSGAATPPGATLKLLSGRTTDVIASVRYHDESMARAWGAMVRQLGTTASGSRALGQTMEGMEAVIRRSIARWFAATFRQGVIRRWWMYNVPLVNGALPSYPSLAFRPRDSEVPVPRDSSGLLGVPPAPGGSPPDPPSARSPLASGRGGGAGRDARGVRGRADGASGRGSGDGQGADGDLGLRAASRLPDRPLRRGPFPHEVAAAVDFAAMDLAYNNGADAVERLLAEDWLPAMIQQAEDAVTFTKTGTVRKRLSRLDASRMAITSPPPDKLTAILTDAARNGMHGAVAELAAQGMDVSTLTDTALEGLVKDQAAAVAQQVADGIRLAASRRAVQVNAGRAPGEVAKEVSTYLNGLAHDWEKSQLVGAVQMATNAARLAIFALIPASHPKGYYISALLDGATCIPCRDWDGHEFPTLAEMQKQMPSGGNMDCLGGARCRCVGIAVLPESDVAPGTPSHLGPG